MLVLLVSVLLVVASIFFALETENKISLKIREWSLSNIFLEKMLRRTWGDVLASNMFLSILNSFAFM